MAGRVAPDIRAAGGVVLRTGPGGRTEVLLVHRPGHRDWSLPKGKVEPDEAEEDCALREVAEETGLECLLGPELGGTRYRDRRGRDKAVRYWAMTVAEELECDWAKVTTEYPTPGQNLARKRVWGNFSTGGSRGIRESQDYVRKGGAAARQMLVQAAANEGKVPATECSVSKGGITHAGSNRRTSYGKVAAAAAKLDVPTELKLKDPKDWTLVGKRAWPAI